MTSSQQLDAFGGAPDPAYFNFRHVLHELGLTSCNETNWLVGRSCRRVAARNGLMPVYVLTTKTAENPSVNAPHTIAHYPMTIFGECVDELRERVAAMAQQMRLF